MYIEGFCQLQHLSQSSARHGICWSGERIVTKCQQCHWLGLCAVWTDLNENSPETHESISLGVCKALGSSIGETGQALAQAKSSWTPGSEGLVGTSPVCFQDLFVHFLIAPWSIQFREVRILYPAYLYLTAFSKKIN